MAYRQAFQASRYELKYLIDEVVVQGIRDFIRPYLVADAYADPNAGNSYPVHSLYLDSPSLTLFHQTVQGMKNRFKLRIRFYDGNPDSPVFLEIKKRTTDVIRKVRAALTRGGVAKLLDGIRPGPSDLISSNGNLKALAGLNEFVDTCSAICAAPCLYVSYTREAYVSPESSQLRVTFDRALYGAMFDPRTAFQPPAPAYRPVVGGTVLELKFTDRFPSWMHTMVEVFNLHRRSMAKYVECVKAAGLDRGLACRMPTGMTR